MSHLTTAVAAMFGLKLTALSDNRDGIRVLRDGVGASNTMTVEMCLDSCADKGYSLGGVEFGRECCQYSVSPVRLWALTDTSQC
jgi:hypothetical protein